MSESRKIAETLVEKLKALDFPVSSLSSEAVEIEGPTLTIMRNEEPQSVQKCLMFVDVLNDSVTLIPSDDTESS